MKSSWFKKIAEAIQGNEDLSDIRSSSVRDVLNGNIFTKRFFQKQYGLLAMIAFLLFMYVDNRYSCESLLAQQIKLKKQIQDAKYESLTISAELMKLSRQSNVVNLIHANGIDLKETSTPPIVITDTIDQ